jgi:hypothetical protein
VPPSACHVKRASERLSVVHPQRGPDERVWTENQGQDGTSKSPCLEAVSFLDGSTVERFPVTHPSTNRARRCSIAVISATWYGRRLHERRLPSQYRASLRLIRKLTPQIAAEGAVVVRRDAMDRRTA